MTNEQNIQPEASTLVSPVEQQSKPLNSELKISSCQELAKSSWPIYKQNITKFISLMLIPLFAFFVLGVLTVFSIIPIFVFHPENIAIKYGLIALIVIVLIIAFCLFIYIAISSQAGMFLLIKNHKDNITVKDAFMGGRKIAVKFFVTNLLVAFFVFLWTLLFIIPGIYMTLAYSMAIWVLVCEGIAGGAAIKKSKQLVKGYWMALFGRYAVVYIAVYAVIMIPFLIFGEKSGIGIAWTVISQVLSFLVAPFIVIYTYHIYLDLKRIKNI